MLYQRERDGSLQDIFVLTNQAEESRIIALPRNEHIWRLLAINEKSQLTQEGAKELSDVSRPCVSAFRSKASHWVLQTLQTNIL
jgi:hypothetical protein